MNVIPSNGIIFLKAIAIGVVAYLLFAVIALKVIPVLFPYPLGADKFTIKAVWVQRLIWEKALNSGIITLAGIPVGICFGRRIPQMTVAVIVASLAYQFIGIAYLIIRFGFAYYAQNHAFLSTLWFSAGICALTAFPTSWIIRWWKSRMVP